MEFTKEQIDNWRAFERVRLGGKYNMFDPRARQAASLEKREYLFVMKNYEALRDEALKK